MLTLLAALLLFAPEWTLVTGARVLDPGGGAWREGVAVAIQDGRVVAVAPLATFAELADAQVIDADGLFVVPGLIDLHVHLLLHPYDEASWDEQVLREALELRTLRAVPAARATLEAGFTTIRELGTEGAGFADVALRDAIAAGIVAGPRVLAATRAIVASGAYGPTGFDPRFELPKGAQVADGVDGVRRAVREQIAAGADWIKVYADYPRRPGARATPTFSQAELEAVVLEAASAGLSVAAHASTDEGMRRAALAGVATIEHGQGASEETLALLAERGVVLCPTLAASEAMAVYGGWNDPAPEPDRLRAARASFRAALASGVRIACGSDAGVFDHGDNARELELMVAWGMQPAGALRSATRTAAEVIGRAHELGSLAPDFVADLVVVEGDPLVDIAALRAVRLVMKEGKVVLDRRGESPEVRETVLALCDRWLAAYSARRFDEVQGLFAPGAIVAYERQQTGERAVLSAETFLERARTNLAGLATFGEWRTAEPMVVHDGAIAFVWTSYLLEADGDLRTGRDGFQLIELDGEWRVSALCFTSRALR